MHRPDNLDERTVFHRVQARIYELLLDGVSVVLSTPTSFGKSLIIDAVVAAKRFKNVVVVVPTIALIDETRRRLVQRFREDYKVITQTGQATGSRNIYVLTPERVADLGPVTSVEFFAIDEFYKLDPRRDPERSPAVNEALYRLAAHDAQFYLLGPSIEDIPEAFEKRFNCRFIRTDYATVASEVARIRVERKERLPTLVDLCAALRGEPTLIYCGSPESARTVVARLVAQRGGEGRPDLASAAAWIAEHFHPGWGFGRALERGIGLHHGKMPRSLAQFAVRSFNEGALDCLVCTSTMIRGSQHRSEKRDCLRQSFGNAQAGLLYFQQHQGSLGSHVPSLCRTGVPVQ